MTRSMRVGEISRFLLAGFTNTLLTMGLFQLLVTFVNPAIAYSLSWLSGLLFAAIAYPTFVFEVKRNLANGLALTLVYACVFFFGLLLLRTLEQFLVNLRWGILIVVGATTALNYFGSRFVLSWLRNAKGCSPS
jgi:putative flippase GtrA